MNPIDLYSQSNPSFHHPDRLDEELNFLCESWYTKEKQNRLRSPYGPVLKNLMPITLSPPIRKASRYGSVYDFFLVLDCPRGALLSEYTARTMTALDLHFERWAIVTAFAPTGSSDVRLAFCIALK